MIDILLPVLARHICPLFLGSGYSLRSLVDLWIECEFCVLIFFNLLPQRDNFTVFFHLPVLLLIIKMVLVPFLLLLGIDVLLGFVLGKGYIRAKCQFVKLIFLLLLEVILLLSNLLFFLLQNVAASLINRLSQLIFLLLPDNLFGLLQNLGLIFIEA